MKRLFALTLLLSCHLDPWRGERINCIGHHDGYRVSLLVNDDSKTLLLRYGLQWRVELRFELRPSGADFELDENPLGITTLHVDEDHRANIAQLSWSRGVVPMTCTVYEAPSLWSRLAGAVNKTP